MSKPKTDWEAIEREYRAGQLSVSEIGRQHGVSHTAINKKAKAEGWSRDLSKKVRQEVSARLVSTEVSAANAREALKLAAERGVEIVTSHRRDLSKLHSVKDVLLTRLSAVLHGQDPGGLCLGDKETPGDLLEKLSRVSARLIPLERQAYNLDEGDSDGPRDATVRVEFVASGQDT